ncbi:MAG: choice-of-anchor D domain-containing protein [Bryobacteraceae bacterium]
MFTAAIAGAQVTPPPFSIRTLQGTTSQVIQDNGTLALPADAVGAPSDGAITITYTGTTPTVSMNIATVMLTGSTDFSLVSGPDLSSGALNLTTSSPAFSLRVRYLPSTSRLSTAKITIGYQESNGRPSTLNINLTGTAPEFTYTYMVLPNGNTQLLNPGDTINFPATAFGETSSAQVTITNRGSGQGVVQGISYTGSEYFVLANLPFPPATIDPGKDLKFAVRFTPDDFPAESGTVQIAALGKSLQFRVQGSGLGAWFEYELVLPNGARPLAPGELIKLPDATIGGEKTTATVRVFNNGNADGRIQALNISGTGFSIVEAPFTPLTMTAGSNFTLKIQFAPTQPGKSAGRLRIGSDNFEVEGNALGANLVYSYASGAASTTVQSSGTVVLPSAAVGLNSSVKFTVKNDGTAPTDVFSINVTGATTVFALSDVPALPRRIGAGESVTFTVTFAPAALGSATGTLRIDTQTFTLSGVGNAPAALPSYTFQGATGTQEPMQQPAIGLSLADAYGLPLVGTLTLTFTSDVFASDPAVQFASGGRTVAFTIPAGSKQAVFPNGATQMRVQTGTVAGTITLTPSFSTQGGIDLTPQTPPSLSLTVAQSAPRLLNVVVSAKTSNSFTLLVTGYATGRAITQMDFQFTGVSGEEIATSRLSLSVEPTFTAWYQSSASLAYGSQFTATVPFTLSGDIKDTTNITSVVDTIKSVSVTLTNRQGASAARSVDLK